MLGGFFLASLGGVTISGRFQQLKRSQRTRAARICWQLGAPQWLSIINHHCDHIVAVVTMVIAITVLHYQSYNVNYVYINCSNIAWIIVTMAIIKHV